jgi:ankyrin repeat protein
MELLVRESDKLQALKAQTSALSVKWDVRQFAGDHASDNFSVFNADLGTESFVFDDEILGMGPYVRARGSQTQHSSRQQQIVPIGNLYDGDLIDLSNDITSPGKWSSELKQAFITEIPVASARKETTGKHQSSVESGPEASVDASMGERSWNVNEAGSGTRCGQEDHTNSKAESIGNEDYELKEELGEKSVDNKLRLEDQDPHIDKQFTSVKSTTSISTLPSKSNLTASSYDRDLGDLGSDSQSQIRPTSPEKSQLALSKKISSAETDPQTSKLEAFEVVPESLKTFFEIDLMKTRAPLHYAALGDDYEMLKKLVADRGKYANRDLTRYRWRLQLDTSSGDGKLIDWTPLSLAAFFGHHRIVELLLTHDPPGPETYLPSFELPVPHAAVASPQYLMMHSSKSKLDLLEFGALKKLRSNLPGFDGENSDEASANFERTTKVISLLQQSRGLRKHLQKEDPKGYTPLHVACCGTSVLVVEKLLDLSDMLSEAPSGIYKLKQLLKIEDINHCDTPLHLAAYWNRVDIVKLLLRKGMDPNAKGRSDRPALHYAAAMGNLDVVKSLVEAGAVVDKRVDSHTPGKCVDSHTPLSLALEWEEWDVAEFLLTSGASLETHYPDYSVVYYVSPKWETIVHKAVKMKSRAAAVKFLCEKGVQVNICDESERTPLHVLAGQDADILETLKCLLQHGARPNMYGEKVSALFILVSKGRASPEVVKCLLDHGANPNGHAWGSYSTPLNNVIKNDRQKRRLEIIKLLLDAGADPSLKDELSRNAVSLVEGRLRRGPLKFMDKPNVDRDEDEEILHLLKCAKRQSFAKRKGGKLIVPKESAVGHLEEDSTGT